MKTNAIFFSWLLVPLAGCAAGNGGRAGEPGETGEQGPEGDPGPVGDQGEPGEDAPSIVPALVAVLPGSLEAGETALVTVLGQNTAFDDSTTVELGDGVTVDSVEAGSATWLSVVVTVADDAAAGPRDVVVAAGEEPLTLAGGLAIGEAPPPFSIDVTSLSAGAISMVTIRAADPVFDQFTLVELCDPANPGEDGACTPAPGIGATAPTVIDPRVVFFAVRPDLYLLNTSVEFRVTTRANGDASFVVPVYETVPTGLVIDEPADGDLPTDDVIDAWAVELDSPAELHITVAPGDPDVFDDPHIEIFDLSDGILARAEVFGDELVYSIYNPGTYYVVVGDDWTDGRAEGSDEHTYTITATTTALPDITADVEDDGVATVLGTIAEVNEQDTYVFTPTADGVFDLEVGPGADDLTSIGDSTLEVIDTSTGTSVGFNDDIDLAGGNYYSRLEDLALTAETTYVVVVAGYAGFATGDYTLTVTRN